MPICNGHRGPKKVNGGDTSRQAPIRDYWIGNKGFYLRINVKVSFGSSFVNILPQAAERGCRHMGGNVYWLLYKSRAHNTTKSGQQPESQLNFNNVKICRLLQRLHADKNKNLFHSLQILWQKKCRLPGNNMAYSEFARNMPNCA